MVQRKNDVSVDRTSLNQSQVYLLSQRHFLCKTFIPFRSIIWVLVSVLRRSFLPKQVLSFHKEKGFSALSAAGDSRCDTSTL